MKKKKKNNGNVLDFVPLKTKKNEKNVAEKGKFSKLNYTVFKRGNLHFTDNNGLTFKKDCDMFEKEIDALDLNALSEGKTKKIKGCGDNDTLCFTCKGGDITATLEKREYSMLTKLKNIIRKGK